MLFFLFFLLYSSFGKKGSVFNVKKVDHNRLHSGLFVFFFIQIYMSNTVICLIHRPSLLTNLVRKN